MTTILVIARGEAVPGPRKFAIQICGVASNLLTGEIATALQASR